MAGLIHIFYYIIALSLIFLNTTLLFAEQDENSISMEVSFFSPFRPSPPALFFRNGESIEQVEFPRTIHGDTVLYEGPRLMKFYTRNTSENGEIVYKQAAEVTLSEDLENPLLIFNVILDRNSDRDIRILPMEINFDRFPKGTISVVNLTGITMQGVIGDHRAQIPPGISDPVSFARNGVFSIGLSFEFDGRVYPSFVNTVTLDPETRQWMFIGRPRQSGSHRVQVRFIEDHTLLRRSIGE